MPRLVSSFRLIQPEGIRSCRDGGSWIYPTCTDGRPWLKEDLRKLRASIRTDADFRMTVAELQDLLDAAEKGTLTFDSSTRRGVVCKMECVDAVLEMRLETFPSFEDGGSRHIRFYFTEPDFLPDRLIALHLMHKRPGPVGLAEQDAHAEESQRRANKWYEDACQ